jgi:hypothetical protein
MELRRRLFVRATLRELPSANRSSMELIPD